MLLTGQASVLTGAPGAVLLYPLLGLLVYPRRVSTSSGPAYLLSRERFHLVLAGFWIFAALLQLQPYWWQPGQISQAIGAMTGLGGLNTIVVDPGLVPLSRLTVSLEVPLNIALIVIFLGLGIGLLLLSPSRRRPLLVLSLLLSLVIWWGTQAFGMILTGMATDFNSGLLILLMTLACWPKVQRLPGPAVQGRPHPDAQESESSARLAGPVIS